jgi:hypothetical protein
MEGISGVKVTIDDSDDENESDRNIVFVVRL